MSDFPGIPSLRAPVAALVPLGAGQPVGDAIACEKIGGPVASAVWPAANRALYLPIVVEAPITIFQLALLNGAVAGEVDCGIYSYPGTGTSATRLASNGKVAMSGENKLQFFNIADQTLQPGVYYLGSVCSTVTTATFRRANPGIGTLQCCGVVQQALAEAKLPETATFAKAETAYAPLVVAFGTEAI